MREPDFPGLVKDLGDAARQPEFTAVHRRAGRLRTRRRLVVTGSVLAVAAVVAAGGYAGGSPGGPGQEVAASPSAAPPQAPRVLWAGAGDVDHLYAMVRDCGDCPARLMASDDAGRTWQERAAYAALPESRDPISGVPRSPFVLGPRILALGLPPGLSSSARVYPRSTPKISIDGGVTWRDAQVSGAPTLQTAPGARLVGCAPTVPICRPHTADPYTGTFIPLATAPPLKSFRIEDEISPAAGLWATGLDKDDNRPAIAVSRDRGSTWTTTVLPDEPPAPVEGGQTAVGYMPMVVTADGQTVYATLYAKQDRPAPLFRSTDGGTTWQRTNPSGVPAVTPWAFVTTDGAHVILQQTPGTYECWISPDGNNYVRMFPTGAAPKFGAPPLAIDRQHYLMAGDEALYTSSDGRTWQRLANP